MKQSIIHKTNNGTNITINDTISEENRVQITEGQDGNLIVTVKPSAKSTQDVKQQTKIVTNDQVKELPKTGNDDTNSQTGIIATVLSAIGLGFLVRRKRQSDK